MRDLDNEILARAAERELHPLSDDEEEGRPSAFDDEFDFDDELKDDKRKRERESIQRGRETSREKTRRL